MEYTIKKGDTLWELAKQSYGAGVMWESIFADNIDLLNGNPDHLEIGQVINIRRRPMRKMKCLRIQLSYYKQLRHTFKVWNIQDEILALIFIRLMTIFATLTIFGIVFSLVLR